MTIRTRPSLDDQKNTVAIVSDGTAVLGSATWARSRDAVMEGKAMLFKEFRRLNSVPDLSHTKDPEEIIRTVQGDLSGFWPALISKTFLRRAAFQIEERLRARAETSRSFMTDPARHAVVVLALWSTR